MKNLRLYFLSVFFTIIFWMIVVKLFSQTATPAVQEEIPFEITNIRGTVSAYESLNLATFITPLTQHAEYVKDAQNVDFDQDLGVTKRRGSIHDNAVSFGNQVIYGKWQYITPGGREYLVIATSNTLAYSLGGSTYTTITSTLSAAFPVECVTAFGSLWCTSSSQSFRVDDSLKMIDVSWAGFPKGNLIEKHVGRLWVGSTSSSVLYASEYLNGMNWSLGGNATDPSAFPVGANDGYFLTGLKSAQDVLFVFKKRLSSAVYGKSNNDFQIIQIDPKIGCLQNRSIQYKQGRLFWLSHRGLEKLEGGQIILTSDPRLDLMKNIVTGFDAPPTRNSILSGQGDFLRGFISWADDTMGSSITISGLVTSQLFKNINTISGVEPIYNPPAVSYPVDASTEPAQFNVFTPTYTVCPNCTGYIDKINIWAKADPGNDWRAALEIRNTRTGLTEILRHGSLTLERGDGLFHKAIIDRNDSNDVSNATATPVIFLGSDINLGKLELKILPQVGLNYMIYRPTETGNASIVFKTSVPFSTQYISEVSTLSTIVKWGTFEAAYTGDVNFFFRTATSVVTIIPQIWKPITSGAVISTPTANNYIQRAATMTSISTSALPVISGMTIKWEEGINKQNVASWVDHDRYLLACTTNTDSMAINDMIYVVDRYDNHTRYSGLNVLSFAEAFGRLYFGSSISTGPDAGFVSRFVDSLDDSGRSINSFIITKDYCFGDCTKEKIFSRLWVNTIAGSQGGTLSTSVQYDKDGIYTPLGDIALTEAVGLIFARVPFPYGSGGVRGRSISFKFENNQVGQDFKFYGAKGFYREVPTE